MLRRLALGLCISLFVMTSKASTNNEELTQTVFELERSVAILQLSKANLEDYQMMNEKMPQVAFLETRVTSLETQIDFFAGLTFLLCMVLVALFVQIHNQHKRLLAVEKVKKKKIQRRSDI